MPTYREDLHLGHEVPVYGTDDLLDGAITTPKIADKAVTTDKIADGAVTTPKIANNAVTTEKIGTGEVNTRNIADRAVTEAKISPVAITNLITNPINAFIALLTKRMDALQALLEGEMKGLDAEMRQLLQDTMKDIQNQIDSYSETGVFVSNQFGNDPHIAVSQRAETAAWTRIWGYLEDKFGECLQGINMIVTPTYFIGNESLVKITATTVETNGIFEKIAFYWNDEDEDETPENPTSFYHDENTGKIDPPIEVEVPMEKVNPMTNQIKVKCKAQIMGIEYTREQMVTHYDAFWLGAGDSYTDMIANNGHFNPDYAISTDNGMRGAYNVDVADGQHIIIIVGKSLREGFIRADLNGMEISFDETWLDEDLNETLDETKAKYVVFTSAAWSEGRYNIDING